MAQPLQSPLFHHYGGRGGSTFLDIPGLVWDTQLGIAQKGLFPMGRRLSFFSTGLAMDNHGQVCPGGYQTEVRPPFCEATSFVSVSCGDTVA